MRKKVEDICKKAVNGSISGDKLYDELSRIAESDECEDDLACVIEDCLMELDTAGSGRADKRKAVTAAKLQLEELGSL